MSEMKVLDFREIAEEEIKRAVSNLVIQKHGHWIDMGDYEQCSVCNATHLKEFQSYYGNVTWIPSAYCGSCGAKMDEVTKCTE